MQLRGAPVIVAAWGVLVTTPAVAGGWTQEPGDAYLKVWNRTIVGRNALPPDSPGAIRALDEIYADHQLQVYGELGLVEGLTWVGYVSPAGLSRYGAERRVYVGPAWTGLRARLVRSGDVVLSAQASVGGRLPVGDDPLFEGMLEGAPLVVRSTAGTAQADGELQLGIGLHPWWLAFHAGARGFTAEAFDPAVYGYAQLGWNASRRVVADLHVNVYWTLAEVTELDLFGITNTRYVGIGLTGSYRLTERTALTASVEGVAFAISNAATPSLNLGVELR